MNQTDSKGLLHPWEPLPFSLRLARPRSFLAALVLVTLLSGISASGAAGQTGIESRPVDADSSYICVLRNEDADAFSYSPRIAPSETLHKTSANIEVAFINQLPSDPWPQQAMNAVNYAASIWAGIVTSQITIRIEASWINLGTCDGSQFSLASAGPQFIYRNFRNAPKQDTWYPDALADAVNGSDLGAGKADILAKFNRNCGPAGSGKWYFGTDGKPPSGTIDMPSVALHEFAHGLGIFGSANVDDGNATNGNECNGENGAGCIGTGNGNDPLSFDRFTEDGSGLGLLSLSNPSTTLGTALEGGRAGGVFFSGPRLTESGFSRARLYAPSTFDEGASYSHLDENTYNRTPEALMTPFLARAESIHVPGEVACGMLADAGWTISGTCSQIATSTQPPETVPETIDVAGPYPNPFADEATILVSVTVDQPIKMDVFDALGRLVLTVFNGVLAAGDRHSFRLDGTDFPPGVYFVTFTGEFGTASRRMIVAN